MVAGNNPIFANPTVTEMVPYGELRQAAPLYAVGQYLAVCATTERACWELDFTLSNISRLTEGFHLESESKPII